MRTILVSFALAIFAMITTGQDRTAQFSAHLNTPVIPVHGGTVFVQFNVRTPRVIISKREPLNVTVVLDRSGSMGDERKIDFARKALHSIVDRLDAQDLFSLIIYDDVVEVLREPSALRNRGAIHRMIDGIMPRGSTNLGGGLFEGLRLAELHRKSGRTNRVILLSDGLANTGITDVTQLSSRVSASRRRAISVSTMGVGLDYNENLMMALSESGGGNYYFIESPASLASIMNKEIDAAATIVCKDTKIRFECGPGVVLRDVVGYSWKQEGDGGWIDLGDLYSDDERELTVELSVPAGTTKREVLSGVLAFDGDLVQTPSNGVSASVAYTEVQEEVEKNRNMEVQGKADVAISTKRVEKALELMDNGNVEEATAEFDRARNDLLNSPAAASSGAGAAAVQEQARRLGEFKDSVQNSDERRSKKAIQYQNYLQQKKKK